VIVAAVVISALEALRRAPVSWLCPGTGCKRTLRPTHVLARHQAHRGHCPEHGEYIWLPIANRVQWVAAPR
jgi:hypothetical protein